MIHSDHPEILLAIDPIDMRAGAEALIQRIQHQFAGNPNDGKVYAFRNKTTTRIKLVCVDGTGVWMAVRRLHRGKFVWPQSETQQISVSMDVWKWLTLGIDWQRMQAKPNLDWQF